MKLYRLAAALALVVTQADAADYAFTFSGTQTHWRNDWECPGFVCSPPVTVTPWTGTMLLTAPSEDGFYQAHYIADVADPIGLLINGYHASLDVWPGPLFGVTIVNGEVASFVGLASQLLPQRWAFDGMSVHWDQPAETHYGQSSGDAQITAVVSHAPEPATYAVLGTGLLLVLGALRQSNTNPTCSKKCA